MRGLGRLSIRVALIGAFVLVAGIGIAAVTALQYHWLTSQFFQEELQDDLTLARAVVAGLDRYLRARIHLVGALAEEYAPRGLTDRPALQRDLDLVKVREPAFVSLGVIDPRGVAQVVSLPLDPEGRPTPLLDYRDQPWFQAAVALPSRASYDVWTGRVVKGPVVTVAAPIRRPDGALVGVVAAGLNLVELRKSIRVLDVDRTDRIAVVDARGRVLVHSSPEWEAEIRDLSREAVFQAAQREREGTVEYRSEFTGTMRWAAFARVPSAGWVVWISRGPEFLGAKVQRLFRDSLVVGVVGTLIAGLAAMAVAGSLSRPLVVLAEATRQVSAQRFATLDFLTRQRSRIGEFQDLLRGFEEMAIVLRDRYTDLEARVAERTEALAQREREAQATASALRVQSAIQRGYGELAALLNSLDRSHILQEGIKKIAASLGTPLVALYLAEPGGRTALRLKTYHAVDATGLDSRWLAPTGLPEEVARRREAAILSASEGPERLRIQTGVGVLEVAAVAAFPLLHRDRMLGVLVVALLDPLSDLGRGFLESAAGQLSVALSNAELFESVRYQAQQLEELNAALRQASEVKSQFLATMSHELRTPLNSIIGFTEVLLGSAREPLSERQRSALERVATSGHHLLHLINDVLDLSKVEAGHMEVRPERLALAPLVLECLASVETHARDKGLAVRTVGLEGAPEVEHDRGKVKQVLLNLLSNALKFTPAGSIEVRVRLEPGDAVAIAVADTGIGIRSEHQEAVFGTFFQVDGSETRAVGGTGLGLGISRRLAELMGGTLTVKSEPGRGSVFTLRLPLTYQPTSAGTGEAPGREEPLGGARLLVIDDDRDVVDLVRTALAGEPIRVEWAAGVKAGLARARARRPSVILLDLVLQGQQDGWDLLDTLKRSPETRDIPVVIHSVIDNPHRARQLGADSVLVKPTPAATLRAVLARLLGRDAAGVKEALPEGH